MKAKQETLLRPEHFYQEPIKKKDFIQEMPIHRHSDNAPHVGPPAMVKRLNEIAYQQALKAQEKPEMEWINDWESRPKNIESYYWCYEHYYEPYLIGQKNKAYSSCTPNPEIPKDKLFWCDKESYDQKLNTWIEGRVQFENAIPQNDEKTSFRIIDGDRTIYIDFYSEEVDIEVVNNSKTISTHHFYEGATIEQFCFLTGLEQIEY